MPKPEKQQQAEAMLVAVFTGIGLHGWISKFGAGDSISQQIAAEQAVDIAQLTVKLLLERQPILKRMME